MEKSERFGLVISPPLKNAGEKRAMDEGLSLAAYIRRLMLTDAKQYGLWPYQEHSAVGCTDTDKCREAHR